MSRRRKPPNRGGRPSKFTTPVVVAITGALIAGEPFEAAARAAGIGQSTLYRWLAKARADVPGCDFRDGELTSLPVDSESVDVAVCALALEHVAELDAAVAELARVLRPGGRLLLSDLHPVAVAVGGAAYFQDAAGGAGVVRGYRHLHGDYLRAFKNAGLDVEQCLEPLIGHEEVQMQGPAAIFAPAAAEAAYLGLPMALIWELRRR